MCSAGYYKDVCPCIKTKIAEIVFLYMSVMTDMAYNVRVIASCMLLLCSMFTLLVSVERNLDEEMRKMNALCADITWKLSLGSDPKMTQLASRVGEIRAAWHNAWCDHSSQLPRRVRRLLCRGPKYTPHQTRY